MEWSQNMWESEATTAGFQYSGDAAQGEYGASSAQRRAAFIAANTYDTALSSGYSSTARDLFRVEGVTRGAYASKVKCQCMVTAIMVVRFCTSYCAHNLHTHWLFRRMLWTPSRCSPTIPHSYCTPSLRVIPTTVHQVVAVAVASIGPCLIQAAHSHHALPQTKYHRT